MPKAPPPRPPEEQARAATRAWVVTVAVVSAATGAFLLLGVTVAGAVHHGFPGAPNGVAYAVAALGPLGGVWVGAWLAGRLTAGTRRRFVGTGLGGVAGLVAAVVSPYVNVPVLRTLVPLVAILLPGIGAAVGARLAQRGEPLPPPPPAPPARRAGTKAPAPPPRGARPRGGPAKPVKGTAAPPAKPRPARSSGDHRQG